MALTDFARRVTDTAADARTCPDAAAPCAAAPDVAAPAPAPRAVGREADGLAVASFVLGLVGLLVFNILLGPTAIVMALLALARRTRRRGRACLGLALGVADLVVLAVLVTAGGTVAWNAGG
ncbi:MULTISPECIES: hypothetical protein [Streptomyces]|uniref:hypothetical protein n=1 Tax=Streptomyces TaxID=1883 RepID=UPI0004CAAD2D|nr:MULTISPECIES: hypothetical protein [Streptomyces]RPK90885.1 hypothetical protein EES46_11980 [Streptomyces sp. ADI98-10]